MKIIDVCIHYKFELISNKTQREILYLEMILSYV